MPLTLRAISLNDQPLTQPMAARFESGGGSIGRADHNTLALPDPERHISRQQAEIHPDGDGYRIRNVGSANPIVVRGQALGRGDWMRLTHGDQVRIGAYLLEVLDEGEPGSNADAGDSTARPLASPSGAAPAAQGAVNGQRPPPARSNGDLASRHPSAGGSTASAAASPFADLGGPLPASNPFADLLVASPQMPFSAPPSTTADDSSAGGAAVSTRPGFPVPPIGPLLDPYAAQWPPASGVAASSAAWASPPPPPPPRAFLPDDFDPFALPAAPPPRPAHVTSAVPAGAFDDLIPSTAPASIDQLFGLQPGGPDPLAGFMAGALGRDSDNPDATPALSGVSTDPMALFDDESAASPRPQGDAQSSRADDVPELRAAFRPPPVAASAPRVSCSPQDAFSLPDKRPPDAAPIAERQSFRPRSVAADPPPQRAVEPAASPSSNICPTLQQSLWAAFCQGADIAVDLPADADPHRQMQLIGELLRAAVTGALQLMMVRATTKHELGAEVTIIRARNNNPLKFSPDATSALEQLLKPPLRGFLAGPAAMTDAMHDLVGHAIGTMAGTRAALEGVLDRFAPQQLEGQLTSRPVLDSVLPMNRKAKLWELYLHHFEALRDEAQEDFHALFGRAFLTAYEQQLERLRQTTGKDATAGT